MRKRRTDFGYQEWRKAVLKRDGYTCQFPGCNSRNRKWLQVHHIIPYSKSVSLKTDVDNGICLCYGCHKDIKDREHHYVNLFTSIVRDNSKK